MNWQIENYDLKKIFYVGNDVNDYRVMLKCGFTACPSDSHVAIKKIANFPLKTKGGGGVVREILEIILELNFINILYPEKNNMNIFIVAEIGINRNGDLSICKELIDVAKDAGCDAVKFQNET